MKKRFVHICVSILISLSAWSGDTVFVSGAVQHDGLLDWKPVMYHSNSYLDLSVHYLNDSNHAQFKELRATTRLELTQWPLPGYETDFAGHGIGHLSVAAAFNWGEITVGDVYGQFGSGLILNLYEDRALGIDGALRGLKLDLLPYKGIHLTLLGGKQRRYWSCYHDHAWGWNYARDAALGADINLHLDEWIPAMQEHDISLILGGSYVSKYEAEDTVMVPMADGMYRYNLPQWIGAGDVRASFRWKGLNILAEYAYKANDPCVDNGFSYRDGNAALLSISYSQKGLSVLAQMKRSDNMAFRSERLRTGIAGRYNLLPAFTQQHTYALAAMYPYATQYADGEWAWQAEIRYSAPKKSKMGGKYGTTLKLGASHIRGESKGEGEFYTDVNIELNKRISKRWWLNAMLMYQRYNQYVVEGHGGMIRSGIGVADARFQVNKNIAMRAELQYLFSPDYDGQWIFALYELTLYHHWTLSGQYMYNIGHAPEATHAHYYTAGLTFNYGAHRANIGYTKTKEGFNCSGGVCRYIPQMEGLCVNYSFAW